MSPITKCQVARCISGLAAVSLMSCAPIEQLAAQAFAAHGTMVAPVADALDDVSFLFYVRTLRLRVGDVDTIRAISSRGAR